MKLHVWRGWHPKGPRRFYVWTKDDCITFAGPGARSMIGLSVGWLMSWAYKNECKVTCVGQACYPRFEELTAPDQLYFLALLGDQSLWRPPN